MPITQTRRYFLRVAALAGAAALNALPARRGSAEPEMETSRVRLAKIPVICFAQGVGNFRSGGLHRGRAGPSGSRNRLPVHGTFVQTLLLLAEPEIHAAEPPCCDKTNASPRGLRRAGLHRWLLGEPHTWCRVP